MFCARFTDNVTVIVEALSSGNDTAATTTSTTTTANGQRQSARMSLNIAKHRGGRWDYCADPAGVCFYDAVVYKIAENSVMHNQTVGALGPRIYRHLCPELDVEYELLNGELNRLASNLLSNI